MIMSSNIRRSAKHHLIDNRMTTMYKK